MNLFWYGHLAARFLCHRAEPLVRLYCRLRGHDAREWWNPERSGRYCVRCGADLP